MNCKKTKLYTSVLVLLIFAIVGIFALTSCGGEEIEQIYVNSSHSPRLNYVEGQDLDLSKGILTVVIDGAETLVPMTSAEVSVSGYDQNKIGEQTLTVSYREATTTIKVNVIKRTVAEGFEKGYFIGDPFNANKGKIKIAKDDATTFTVNMNGNGVTLKEFDSATPGIKTVVMEYTDGTNTYTCTFNVEVYDASDVQIVFPTKTAYYSHDSGIDFTGGYLTVYAGEGGSIKRHIELENATVSGFDLSAATAANRTTPFTQKVTIEYLGFTFTYDISITYSGVSVINDLMPTLAGVDIFAEKITLTEAERAAAIEGINEYYKLTNRHKQVLSEETVERLVRCATAELERLYAEALADCSDVIKITETGGVQFTSASYANAIEGVAKLKDEKHGINVYGALLADIKADFADYVYSEDVTYSDGIIVISELTLSKLIGTFEHMIEIYETIEAVPDTWTKDDLATYKEAIVATTDLILGEDYSKTGNSGIYSIVSAWRTNRDLSEIIYSYYIYADDEHEGTEYLSTVFSYVPLPKTINQWYSIYYNAMNFSKSLYNGGTNYAFQDTTTFMYYFDVLLTRTTELLANTEDTLSIDIYELLGGSALIDNVRSRLCGYYYHMGIVTQSQGVAQLWNDYLELVDLYVNKQITVTDSKVDTVCLETYADKFDALMKDLEALSPSEIYGFLSSLNFLYSSAHGSVLSLSKVEKGDGDYFRSMFASFLDSYYNYVLGENEAYPMYVKLIAAIETYSLVGSKATALEEFKAMMAELEALTANTANMAKFEQYLGDIYAKYVTLYNNCTESDIELDTTAEAYVTAIVDCIDQIIKINDYINDYAQSEDENKTLKEGTYLVLFALYERVNYYHNELMKLAAENEDICTALYTRTYVMGEDTCTIDKAFHTVGTIYWKYMTNMTLSSTTASGAQRTHVLYDIYATTNLRSYLIYATELLFAGYTENYEGLEAHYVSECFKAYHSLSRQGITLLCIFGGQNIHLNTAATYYATAFADDANNLALANKLIEAARAYIDFAIMGATEEKRDAFYAIVEEAMTLQEAVAETEAYTSQLAEIYEKYVEIYDSLKNSTEDDGNDDDENIDIPTDGPGEGDVNPEDTPAPPVDDPNAPVT